MPGGSRRIIRPADDPRADYPRADGRRAGHLGVARLTTHARRGAAALRIGRRSGSGADPVSIRL